MRIGIDCRIAHYTRGGTGVYTRRLVQALAELPGVNSDDLLLLQAAESSRPLAAGLRHSRLFTPSHHRWEQMLLPLELLPRRLDVLHSPDFIPPFVRNCRSVVTVHDLAFLKWPENLTAESRSYFNRQIRRAVRSADSVIAVSHATKRDLMDLLGVPAGKIEVVYEAPGFDLRPLDEAEVGGWLRCHGFPEDYVLFVGTFEPRKNLTRLVDAFMEVRRRGYAGKLLLVGSPGWLAEPILEAVAGTEGQVLIRGFEPAELPYLYNGARLLAWPSLYEGFGLPLLEAMSCGTPVLTSNVSSLPEIAGDAALLVDPWDVESIAAGLQRLLEDADLSLSLRDRGLARAAEFSWEHAAKQTLDVYHRLS